jgi:hypothetical protein
MMLHTAAKHQRPDVQVVPAARVSSVQRRRPPCGQLADLSCTNEACTKRFRYLSSFIRHLENSPCSSSSSQAFLRSDVIVQSILGYLASSTISFDEWLSMASPDDFTGCAPGQCMLCRSRRSPQQALSRTRATAAFASLSGFVQHLETHPVTFERDLGLCKVANFLKDAILGEELPGRLLLLGPSRWSIWS